MLHTHEKGNMLLIVSVLLQIKRQCTKSPRLLRMTERTPWGVLETCHSLCLIPHPETIWGCYSGTKYIQNIWFSLIFLSSLLHLWMLQARWWQCQVYTCWIIPNSGDATVLIPRGWHRERGDGEKLFLEVRISKVNSYHLGMPAGISWSIIGQHAPGKLDSGRRFAEQVSPNSFAISGVWQPVLQMKPSEGKIQCKSFKELLATLYFREKDDWPPKCIEKNIFQFLLFFIFAAVCAPQNATIFRVFFFLLFYCIAKTIMYF